MKKTLTTILLIIVLIPAFAQQKIGSETEEQKKERMAWWTNDRFGMFIHWGIYAQPARGEWVKSRGNLTEEEYQTYFDNFNPDLYNPREWAKTAKNAGMKYAVITTKHHDGFCLFDSKYTDYKSTNTPVGKDLIREWVEAFRAEGLGIGFYYSLLDWHHPHYSIDSVHPLAPKVETDEAYIAANKGRDMEKYREYMRNQVTELLTNYGKIDILWLDFSWKGIHAKNHNDWHSEKMLGLVRKLQPGIIINDRLDLKNVEGGWDFTAPEQFKVAKWPEVNGKKVPWETCQTLGNAWGYHRDDYNRKDNRQLLVLLIESVSKGGNLLLNVGPNGRGEIDSRAQESLKKIGDWMKYNSRSVYGCTQAPENFKTPENCLLTYNPKTNRLYVHLLEYPLNNLILPGFKGKFKYAQFLHDASELKAAKPRKLGMEEKEAENDINLGLPVIKPNVEIPVIEMILQD